MGIPLVDGFDLYNGNGTNTGLQAKWTAGGTTRLTLVSGRFTGQGARFGSTVSTTSPTTSARAYRTLPSSYAGAGFGFALKVDGLSGFSATAANGIFCVVSDSGTAQVGVGIRQDGTIEAWRLTGNNAGTSLGTSSAGVIVNGTWHFIEFGADISDTTGTIKLKVDGTSILNLSSQDTRNGAPTTVNRVEFQCPVGTVSNDGSGITIDDLYGVDSSTTLGERRVETNRPNADTAQKDFTASTGSDNYAMVDDTTANGDTDYVQASTVGNLDLYGHAGLSSTPTTIDAVQLTAFAEKTDVTSRSIALSVKSGATSSDGSNFALAASYGKFERVMETDPATSAAWDVSGVNNLTFGAKVTV